MTHLTLPATFLAGLTVGIAGTILGFRHVFKTAARIVDEDIKQRRERRAARDRHGRLRVVDGGRDL